MAGVCLVSPQNAPIDPPVDAEKDETQEDEGRIDEHCPNASPAFFRKGHGPCAQTFGR